MDLEKIRMIVIYALFSCHSETLKRGYSYSHSDVEYVTKSFGKSHDTPCLSSFKAIAVEFPQNSMDNINHSTHILARQQVISCRSLP